MAGWRILTRPRLQVPWWLVSWAIPTFYPWALVLDSWSLLFLSFLTLELIWLIGALKLQDNDLIWYEMTVTWLDTKWLTVTSPDEKYFYLEKQLVWKWKLSPCFKRLNKFQSLLACVWECIKMETWTRDLRNGKEDCRNLETSILMWVQVHESESESRNEWRVFGMVCILKTRKSGMEEWKIWLEARNFLSI